LATTAQMHTHAQMTSSGIADLDVEVAIGPGLTLRCHVGISLTLDDIPECCQFLTAQHSYIHQLPPRPVYTLHLSLLVVSVTCRAASNSCERVGQKEMQSKLFVSQLQAMTLRVSQKCCMMERTQVRQHCTLIQCKAVTTNRHAPGGEVSTIAVVQIESPVESSDVSLAEHSLELEQGVPVKSVNAQGEHDIIWWAWQQRCLLCLRGCGTAVPTTAPSWKTTRLLGWASGGSWTAQVGTGRA